MSGRSVHISQMAKHFLYLPLYYAKEKNCFGYLPEGVRIEIGEPITERTDAATYDQMMSDSPDHRDFEMAITDPTQIFRTPLHATRLPAVLATLVTNGAFWAINHASYKIKTLGDLGVFDRVIAYSQGTTSYNIAARIAHESGKGNLLQHFIQVVAPGTELILLTDAVGGANAVALSPDILHIEELESRKQASVELIIGDTEEYNDVVATALVSNNDFVARNPEIVQGVVKGIQHALSLIHRADPDVLRFARSHFKFANRAEGALTKAIKAGAIPRDVSVAKPHWMSAAKASCAATHLKSTWDRIDETKALDYYETCIHPYAKFAIEAQNSIVFTPPLPSSPPGVWATLGQIAITFLIATGVTTLWGWLPAFIIAMAMIFAWGFSRLLTGEKVRRLRIAFLVLLWITGLGVCILPFIEAAGFQEKKIELMSLAVAFFIPAIWETINYVDRIKK